MFYAARHVRWQTRMKIKRMSRCMGETGRFGRVDDRWAKKCRIAHSFWRNGHIRFSYIHQTATACSFFILSLYLGIGEKRSKHEKCAHRSILNSTKHTYTEFIHSNKMEYLNRQLAKNCSRAIATWAEKKLRHKIQKNETWEQKKVVANGEKIVECTKHSNAETEKKMKPFRNGNAETRGGRRFKLN